MTMRATLVVEHDGKAAVVLVGEVLDVSTHRDVIEEPSVDGFQSYRPADVCTVTITYRRGEATFETIGR